MRSIIIFSLLTLLYTTGCAHVRAIHIRTASSSKIPTSRALHSVPGTPKQRQKIAEVAQKHVGSSRVDSNRSDCSGTVRGIYKLAGYPLGGRPASKHENDVTTLYRYVYDTGSIYESTPLPGDLVFFHDTFDPKGAKDYEDRLTHIGIVHRVFDDGTVAFVHHLNGRIIISYLNLKYPHKRNESPYKPNGNSGIRRAGQGRKTLTTAQLFAGYGRVSLW